jgi:nucleoid-associated protein EbfC
MNINDLMGQLQKTQAQMQEQMEKQQKLLDTTEVIGQSGGGLVRVFLNGRYSTRRVEVDRNLLKDDPEMAEDLIAAAFNDAANKINDLKQSQMQSMASTMQLPPGMKLPF